MKTRLSRHFHAREAPELNITAFMNLMVVLVPFLLITAVFSRITILELNLPPPSSSDKPNKPKLELEVVVRSNVIDVQDRSSGHLKSIRNEKDVYDTKTLSEFLRVVKGKYPDIANASILLEPEIAYETLVLVMDTVRSADVKQDDGSFARAELFPEISIGDAPITTSKKKLKRRAKK